MKTIRQSIFETNSSSTHVFSFKNTNKSVQEQLMELKNNSFLFNNFKFSIFKSKEEEINCCYWVTFDDFQYTEPSKLKKWREKLDFWLQAIILYNIEFSDKDIYNIENNTAKPDLNTNDKLFYSHQESRVIQSIWKELSLILGLIDKDSKVNPELHISNRVSLDSGFHNTPLCDYYFLFDENKNIIGIKESVLEKIALNILDPDLWVVPCADEDWFSNKLYKEDGKQLTEDLFYGY